MNRETIKAHAEIQLDVGYWNNGRKDTFAKKEKICPVKDMFVNQKGSPKRRELRKGKSYEATAVFHTLREGLVFYCYILKNDLGETARYYLKSNFISSSEGIDRKIKEIFDED